MTQDKAVVKVDIDIVKEFGIEPSAAAQIEAVFAPMVAGLKGFEKQFNAIAKLAKKGITPEVSAAAKRLRLDIGKVRISADKAHKKEKEYFLLGGRAVDGVRNILKFAVTQKEDKLREIEEHFERQEQAAREKVAETRRMGLDAFGFDYSTIHLADMEEGVYERFYAGVKLNYELEQAAIEAEEKARVERERLEAEDRQRIKDENAQLHEEQQRRRIRLGLLNGVTWNGEDVVDIETGEVVASDKEVLNLSNRDFDKLAGKHNKAVATRLKQKQKKEKADRERREELEREELERKQKEKAERKIRLKARQAPDKAKILTFINTLASIEAPNMRSIKGRELVERVKADVQKINAYLKQAESEM